MILRELTDQGIRRYRDYILSVKQHPDLPPIRLDSAEDSRPFFTPVEIDETRQFRSRVEMARYLSSVFERAGLSRRDVVEHHGMWTWLACIWFDTICPLVDGKRKVNETARYICSTDWRDYYRHYILANYDIYSSLGEQNSKLFLWGVPYELSDFIEQIASRQWFISSVPLVQVAHKLYWDEKAQRPKRGATDRNRAGTLRRLRKVAEQLELTYDVHSMTPDAIIALLPEEFQPWIR